MKTKFPHYPPTKEERAVITRWENESGFALLSADQVTSQETLIDCMKRNVRWLQDHVQETNQIFDNWIYRVPR